MTVYECDWCHETYRWPISAALCCDEVSNDLADELDLDGTSIHRSTD